MSNKIQINVTVTCAAPTCTNTARGTMELVQDFYESPGTFSLDRVPGTVVVLSNLEVWATTWGQVPDRRHPTHAQPGDWLCGECF